MDKFCRRAARTVVDTRAVTLRRCGYCGTHGGPWSKHGPAHLTARDMVEGFWLFGAAQRETPPAEASFTEPLQIIAGADDTAADSAGPGNAGRGTSNDGADEAIDAWLRFRPASSSGE